MFVTACFILTGIIMLSYPVPQKEVAGAVKQIVPEAKVDTSKVLLNKTKP